MGIQSDSKLGQVSPDRFVSLQTQEKPLPLWEWLVGMVVNQSVFRRLSVAAQSWVDQQLEVEVDLSEFQRIQLVEGAEEGLSGLQKIRYLRMGLPVSMEKDLSEFLLILELVPPLKEN